MVDHGDIAGAHRLQQAGHAELRVFLELQRVAEPGIDAADDDVHGFQSAERAQPDAAVAHGEIVALDQRVAEVGGEEGLLEVGFVLRAGSQDDDPRFAGSGVGGEGFEGLAQGPEEAGDAADAGAVEKAGHRAGHYAAIFHDVAAAGGCLGAVVDDPHPAVRAAGEVGGVEDELAFRGQLHAVAGPQVAAVGVDQLGRQPAAGDQPLVAVEVGQDVVEQLRALDQAGLDVFPILLGDDPRHGIELPRAVFAAGRAMDAVGHAVFAQQPADFRGSRPGLLGRKPAEPGRDVGPGGIHAAIGGDHFIPGAARIARGQGVFRGDGGRHPGRYARIGRAWQWRGRRMRHAAVGDPGSRGGGEEAECGRRGDLSDRVGSRYQPRKCVWREAPQGCRIDAPSGQKTLVRSGGGGAF